MDINVGVIAVQGAVSEHIGILKRAMKENGIEGKPIPIRKSNELEKVAALIIPGGESTAISKQLVESDLFNRIVERGKEGLPIMGTCAGCVLLAKRTVRKKIKLLGLMDMTVERNAFGRQRESFEQDIDICGLERPFHGIFIRAPIIANISGECKILARIGDKIIMAKQKNLMAVAFHPELSNDTRIHRAFLSLIK